MRLDEVVWKERFAAKIDWKHGVAADEVEEVLYARPHTRKSKRGRVPGEDLYVAYGRTEAGRYLIVFFVHKPPAAALPISARDMTKPERRLYEQAKKSR